MHNQMYIVYDSGSTSTNEHLPIWGRLLRRARWLYECRDSKLRKPEVFAFAGKGNRFGPASQNSYRKTHPRQDFFARRAGQPARQYLHAEVAALLRAPKDCDTLYVFRFTKDGQLALAKPCPVCQLAIKHFGIRKVFHS